MGRCEFRSSIPESDTWVRNCGNYYGFRIAVVIRAIRSLAFMTGMFVAILIFWPIAVAVYFCSPNFRSRVIGFWAHFVICWLRITCGLRHEVEGLENLPQTPSVIFSKHQSAWETIAFQTIFPPQAWVLKRSLLFIPFFGWGLAATRPIAIDRTTVRKALEQVVKQGVKVLEEGRWVVIFPEGTRIEPGEHGNYNASASLLAIRASVPLVPVAHNAGDYWRRRGFSKYPGTIRVKIGKPISSENIKPRELNRIAEEWMRETMPTISASYSPDGNATERNPNDA